MDEILNDWNQYKLLVTSGLSRLNKEVGELRMAHNNSMLQLGVEIAKLQVSTKNHARLWGLIAGAIPSMILLVLTKVLN